MMKDKIIEILKENSFTYHERKCSIVDETEFDLIKKYELSCDDFEKVAECIEELYNLDDTIDITTNEDYENGVKRYLRKNKKKIIEDE